MTGPGQPRGARAAAATCPICGKPPSPEPRLAPFCSPRCKMVDLGRWFTEAYRVPGPDAETPGEPPGAEEDEDPGRDR